MQQERCKREANTSPGADRAATLCLLLPWQLCAVWEQMWSDSSAPDQRLSCLCSSCELQLPSTQRGTGAYGVSTPPHHHHNTVSLRSAGKLLTRGAWALLALRYWAVWKGLANTMCCQVLPSRMHNVEKEAASPSVLSLSLSLCLSWTLCVSLPKSVSLSLYVCVVCVRLCVACSCVRLHVYVYMCDIG